MRKYTRIGTFLLALVMCLTMLTAQAESKLPLEVEDLFTVKAWAHYAIANQPDMPENKAFAVMQEKSGYEAALLVMRNTKSETNVLVLAEKSSAQADWKITMRNWGAVGQGDANVPQLAAIADGRFAIYYPNGDSAYFTHEANGWQLTNLSFGDTIQVEVSRSGMTFLTLSDNGKWVKTTVSGVVETAMAQFSMDRFPRTVKAAREHLTNPPTIPDSPWSWTYPYGFPQPSQYAKLAAGKQYAVYSAPSYASFRAANGKALLSTNDWVQVFFEEDGYLLVQYAISRHQYRIGYIKADAVKDLSEVNAIGSWANYPAEVLRTSSLTDDPLNSCGAVMTLQQGQQVTYLGQLGLEWAFVETTTAQGKQIRGFVELSNLNVTLPTDTTGDGING